jgi:hypothetical protein
MTDVSPLKELIARRCRELGLSRGALATRMGYINRSKVLRRLDQAAVHGLAGAEGAELIVRLAVVLELPEEIVSASAAATRAQIDEERRKAATEAERRWRERFVPHAIILTDQTRPTQIVIAAMIGVERLLRLHLDLTQPRYTFARQAISGLLSRYGDRDLRVPLFGRATGIIVNHSPDRALHHDLDGRAVALLAGAHRPGCAAAFTTRRKR